jgi:alpha-tubulin suppressor-like RCC1 family protein
VGRVAVSCSIEAVRYATQPGRDEDSGQAETVGGRGPLKAAALVVLAALVLATPPPPLAAATSTTPGQLFAFGSNYSGQLGVATNINTLEPNPTPTLVMLPGASGPVTEVAAGGEHTLALTATAQLYAFGENYYGQLGNTTNNEKPSEANPVPTLVTVPGATGPVTQIAAGAHQSLVVTSTGQLYAFGENYFGQLGTATNDKTHKANPTPTLVSLPGASGPAVQVAAGEGFGLALTSTGQLYSFGEDRYGQLGVATDSTTEPNPTPTLVTLPGASGPVIQISAGVAHSLALTSTGQLFAFGDNQYGELGNTTNNKSEEPNPTPVQVALPGATGSITEIAAGGYHSLVLTSTGQLYAFGFNSWGQLGNTTNENSQEPNPTPTQVTLPASASGRVVQVAASVGSSLAVTASGQLYTFGYNEYGQLGTATNEKTEEPNPTPSLVAFPGGATIDTLARGSSASHALAVVADLAVATSSLPSGQLGTPYSAQVQALGGTPPYTWSAMGLPPGLSLEQTTGAISGTPTVPGTYTATITVVDNDGVQASMPFAIVVSAPSSSLATPPAIESARESAKRWREGNKLAQISRRHRPPLGSTVSFALNEQAAVSFSFTQKLAGRQVGHKCVATTHKNSKHRACKRTVTAGTLHFAGHTATNRVAFQGRLSPSKKLKPGSYTLVITATNSAGMRSAPVSLSFTIVK